MLWPGARLVWLGGPKKADRKFVHSCFVLKTNASSSHLIMTSPKKDRVEPGIELVLGPRFITVSSKSGGIWDLFCPAFKVKLRAISELTIREGAAELCFPFWSRLVQALIMAAPITRKINDFVSSFPTIMLQLFIHLERFRFDC